MCSPSICWRCSGVGPVEAAEKGLDAVYRAARKRCPLLPAVRAATRVAAEEAEGEEEEEEEDEEEDDEEEEAEEEDE